MPGLATEDDIYAWALIIVLAYVAIAYGICLGKARFGKGAYPTHSFGLTRVFDGLTLAASIMLLLGITHPAILALMGNMKPFLTIAGLVGAIYALHNLFEGRDAP